MADSKLLEKTKVFYANQRIETLAARLEASRLTIVSIRVALEF